MAVLPGSLDYLYYNGITETIPYEAYSMTPMTPSGMAQMSGMGMGYSTVPMMNGSQYLQAAQRGLLYNTYTHQDTFVNRNNFYRDGEKYSIKQKAFQDGEGYGRDVDYEIMANGQEGKNFRQAISDAAARTKETVSNSPNWVKGLLAGGIVVGTVCCLLRGKKPAAHAVKNSGFWAKCNPKNWF